MRSWRRPELSENAAARVDGVPTFVMPTLVTPPPVLAVAVRSNAVGDIVAFDGIGEVVLLPRLWGFELVTVGDAAVLQTPSRSRGLTAVVSIDDGLAHVDVVSATSRLAQSVASAA
jgi:hypothetical protein